MPSNTFFNALVDRSKDALYAFAGIKSVQTTSAEELIPDSVFYGIVSPRWDHYGPSAIGGVTSFRRILFWVAIGLVLLLIAVLTNPTESSFRSHLTELSLRRHLADLRTSDDHSSSLDEDNSSIVNSTAIQDRSDRNGMETPPIAPFRFANHVSISLRTPALIYRTCFFFSLCFTSPPSPPAFLSDPVTLSIKNIGKHSVGNCPSPPDRVVVFFGFLGHWVLLGELPGWAEWILRFFGQGRREKGRKKGTAADKPGVIELRAIASKEEASPAASRSTLSLGPSLAASKLFLRSDSNTNLPEHGALPLHSHNSPIPHTSLSPESRRPSMGNLISLPPAPSHPDTPEPTSPVLTALKAELAAAQSTLTDLRNQLLSQEESMQDAHSVSQSSLDELRFRKKEDDAERQELKSRTKNLEEQKRQAEGARREAEKKLKAVEAIRDGLESKIAAALSEMAQIRENMGNSEKSLRSIQEDGDRHVIETREAGEVKRQELEHLEEELGELDGKNEELGRMVKEAEERLKEIVECGENARRIAPEEEMMMMAAAYEAAATEGYLYGHQHQKPNHAHSGNPWASQAAAYMAEAGMPHLDQSYTARPANSTSGFGHLSRASNSASHRDLTEAGKRLADVSGFEDFGPGANAIRRSPYDVAATGVGHGQATTPPASDSESDIYAHDLGSPNGIMSSSFTANLLPQGLLGSLEGDATPIDVSEPLPSRLEEPLPFDSPRPDDKEQDHESGSESGSEEDAWRSPMTESKVENEKENKRFSGGISRFLPTATNSSKNQHAFVPPPASRRWFSGTGSSDNVNAFNFIHPIGTTSNDSLSNLGPGYDFSPFAPSASEKKALKWGPLSKYRWAGNNRTTGDNENGQGSGPGSSQQSLDTGHKSPFGGGAYDLFRNVPGQIGARSSSVDLGSSSSGSNWLSARHATYPNPNTEIDGRMQNGNGEVDEDPAGENEEKAQDRKAPFRFFSLRKPSSTVWSSS